MLYLGSSTHYFVWVFGQNVDWFVDIVVTNAPETELLEISNAGDVRFATKLNSDSTNDQKFVSK